MTTVQHFSTRVLTLQYKTNINIGVISDIDIISMGERIILSVMEYYWLYFLLCVRAEYWKARLSRRRCPSSNKVRNQVPGAVYVRRPTKSGIYKVSTSCR